MKTNWKLQRQEKAKRKVLKKEEVLQRLMVKLPFPKVANGNSHQRRIARRFLVYKGKPKITEKKNDA